jgi:outer membrane protein insertion porin family
MIGGPLVETTVRRKSDPMNFVFSRYFAFWLVLAFAAIPRLEAQGLHGRPIQEIRIEGLRSLSEETLRFYLDLDVGQSYDSKTLNTKIHELWSRQLIDDIRVDVSAAGTGVRVVIAVVERPTLRSVEYEGLKRISRTDISDKIARESIRVREGDPLNMGEVFRLKAAIEELYAEKGFRLAEAQYSIETVSTGDRRIFFTIDEGDKVRVADIDFEGNTVFKDARLRWAMKDTKESGMITKIMKKDIYKPASLDEDLDKVREVYRKAGYKNVVLGDPEIDVRPAKPNAPDVEDQKRRLFITIPIEEGDRWKLGEITIEGNERFSDEILLRQFGRPKGGWLRSSVIDDGLETIRELYSNTGHLFAKVEPELVERPQQVADLIIHLDEGDQFRVGRIEFIGNSKTRDKVLRREMGIQEGMVLNTGALKNSLLRIGQMEIFKIDEDDPVAFDFQTEEQKVDLSIKGEEGERTELLFGGGFSEVDGFFGQFQFKTRNFLGRGETLGVSMQIGARQDRYDLSYFVPWFMDRPQSIGASVFRRRLDYTLLTGQKFFQDQVGGSVTYGRNLGLFRTLSASLSRYDAKEERTDFNLQGDQISQRIDREVSMFRLAMVKDRRDSRLQPTVGGRYSLSVDVAGGPLGGTTDFWRPQGSYSKYIPVTKGRMRTTAAFNIEAGYIEPLGDDDLFFNDRFYLGGENSIRGFRFRSIWTRDKNGNTITDEFGFPLGGDRSLQTNVEYHFILKGPFRFILYVDGGNVFAEDQEISIDNYRISTGAELQVNVPMLGAPLRFIYARNIDPLPDDRFETFQFSIGPSF